MMIKIDHNVWVNSQYITNMVLYQDSETGDERLRLYMRDKDSELIKDTRLIILALSQLGVRQ